MDYLEYFELSSEPFSNAPLSRLYFASRQHTEALERLRHAAASMRGLALLIGDIGLGKTTLARRMLESLPEEEYEAAMLVIVHAGITPNWLLKRIAIQLGVPDPADDKLTILSQLYQRLVQIYESGKRAVVLIDEAQMLASRELMEEFRGLLNLEVPERKLISFIFFGLPEIERNLRLDPPLAQRVATRYHMKPLGREDTIAYITHRLRLAGGGGRTFFLQPALDEIYRFCRGVPRLINTLCDNLLLEMFFAKVDEADAALVRAVAENLGFGRDFDATADQAVTEPERPADPLAVEGGPGYDAVLAVRRGDEEPAPASLLEPDAIARQVAAEPLVEEAPAPRPLAEEETPPALEVVPLPLADEETPPLGTPRGAPPAVEAGEELWPEAESKTPPKGRPAPLAEVDPEVTLPEHTPAADDDRGPPATALAASPATTTVDIEDPLAFLADSGIPEPPAAPSPWIAAEEEGIAVEVHEADADVPELGGELEVVEEMAGVDVEAEVTVEEGGGDDAESDLIVEVESSPPAAPAIPAPRLVVPAPVAAPAAVRPAAARKSSIDLGEIDALLADINTTLAKK